MTKKVYYLQSLVLLVGTVFAWFTVYTDFARFYHIYGSIIRIKNCTVPNPITTPCFYGAFAFLGGLIWSLFILRKVANKLEQQKKLNILLIVGTIFAWGNFFLEAVKFYTAKSGGQLSCSGVPTNNIFSTSCFYGSVLFFLSLIISMYILRKRVA